MANFLKSLFIKGVEVDTASATSGQVLQFNGTKFLPASAAGGASISDTPPSSPSVGQIWYESDTGKTFVYYDSFWVEVGGGEVGPTGQGVVSGGTSGQVLTKVDSTNYNTQWSNSSSVGGLVLVGSNTFTGATQVDFLNVFSSDFQTYRIEFENLTATTGDDFFMRFRSSAGIISTTDYLTMRNEVTDSSNSGFYAGGGYADALRPTYIEAGVANMRSTGYMEVFNPNLADYTTTSSTFSRVGNSLYVVNATGYFRLTTALTGFSFVRGGSGTITGKATVYGYRTN